MTKNDVVKLFDKINVWKRGGQRAPHKALLLLYALARCQQGANRLIPYSEIDPTLRKFLMEFGPPRKSYHPEYPFWRLQNDNIWEIPDKENLTRRKGNTDAKKSELFKHDVHGGFSQTIYDYLVSDTELCGKIVKDILVKNFPESIHEEIMEAVGLSAPDYQKGAGRNPEFRERVIRAYEFKCAVCGYDLKIGYHNLGLEAAHIKWHMAGGPDIEQNGLALCVLHHRMFDRGAFSISAKYNICISQHVHGSIGMNDFLLGFNGNKIRMPQSNIYAPRLEFLKWHYGEVFRKPERS